MKPFDNMRVQPLIRPSEHAVDLKRVDFRAFCLRQGQTVALPEILARFK
jgi:hypothetical protein